jgi:poly(3-hydroxyalkanoate) synthetase
MNDKSENFPDQPVPDWVQWVAQDSSGAWWGYSVEPLRNDSGWYENEVGDYVLLSTSQPADWPNSLQRIKHY